MNKVYYDNDLCISYLHNIIRQLVLDNFKPEYIIGLTRGGLIPATYLSHYFNIPLHTLHVSLLDDSTIESKPFLHTDAYNGKKILIVDDINDTGATLHALKNNWESNYNWSHWDEVVWNKSVKFAVLIDNLASSTTIDYAGVEINKVENPEWCVFPWEQWWSNEY